MEKIKISSCQKIPSKNLSSISSGTIPIKTIIEIGLLVGVPLLNKFLGSSGGGEVKYGSADVKWSAGQEQKLITAQVQKIVELEKKISLLEKSLHHLVPGFYAT